jgi:hypothetical protein
MIRNIKTKMSACCFTQGQHIVKFLQIIQLSVDFYPGIIVDLKKYHIFVPNNTCHASRKISAPGRVFAF